MPKLKPNHISPTPEESVAIRAAVAEDPDTFLADAEWFREAKPLKDVLPELWEAWNGDGQTDGGTTNKLFKNNGVNCAMNDEQLRRSLQSIGKECFVTYFEDFNDRTQSADKIARRIAKDRNVSYQVALNTRVGTARRIISARRGRDALVNCSQSSRLPLAIRNRAAHLVKKLFE